ncbi:MAG: SUMF1/EgtB/PvdO family nonheme iron enzyme [Anaerolineales bacterium]|nr:SUMF1/EgtB/PvdO family nonheme iron enzyme [Anaerolineales bacterium]MCZ2289137.1 SUMF1/EgtB/PvdO family nonheme iron enzyme [Anaerolineales bacterium]
MPESRPLKVFLCHASADKPAVRELYRALKRRGVQPWLDAEDLIAGQNWEVEIPKALFSSDAVIVCLSPNSVDKEGYVQKEIKFALDKALEMPEGRIFLIPAKLEACELPFNLKKYHAVDLFEKDGYAKLMKALKLRAAQVHSADVNTSNMRDMASEVEKDVEKGEAISDNRTADNIGIGGDATGSVIVMGSGNVINVGRQEEPPKPVSNILTLSNGMEFMRVPAGEFLMGSGNDLDRERPRHRLNIPYDYWMGRFPVTNEQYGLMTGKSVKGKERHPVVGVSWYDAQKYVAWLNQKYQSELPEGYRFRLPSEAEWEKAARGVDGRIYPWGNKFDAKKCNTEEGKKKGTTPVGLYSPQGDSPFDCADMAGNVWEWTRSLWGTGWDEPAFKYPYRFDDGREDESADKSIRRVLRGGSFHVSRGNSRCAMRSRPDPNINWYYGFRVGVSPIPSL